MTRNIPFGGAWFRRPGWMVLAWVLLSLPAPVSAQRLTIGAHPYLPATTLTRRFSPLAHYLARRLDRPVHVSISRDYQDHIRAVGEGRYDIAFIGPASYVQVAARYGPQRLLARYEVNGAPLFRGCIVTRADSPIQALAELKGRSFAFGDPESTMSSLLPASMLESAGVGLDELSAHDHLSNHRDVALGVLLGRFDAGAVKESVFKEYEQRGLRVIAWTPAVSEHLFVARQGLSSTLVSRIRSALLDLASAPDGRRVLPRLKAGLTGLVPVEDADYDSLRRMLNPPPGADRP